LDKLRDDAMVIEGTWEEIRAREADLRGHRLRVIVLPDAEQLPGMLTGADFLQYLTDIGFVGEWADRSDIPDSPEYARLLRAAVSTRNTTERSLNSSCCNRMFVRVNKRRVEASAP